MKWIDRIACGFLALGACGHLIGTFKYTEPGSGLFVWSLSGVLAAALIAAINFIRTARPDDKTIVLLALAGNVGWVVVVGLFGQSIHDMLDPRVLMHGVTAAVLAVFSVRNLVSA